MSIKNVLIVEDDSRIAGILLKTIEKMTTTRIPTNSGEFLLCCYRSGNDNKTHLALVLGDASVDLVHHIWADRGLRNHTRWGR